MLSRPVSLVVVIALLAGAGWFGYQQWTRYEAPAAPIQSGADWIPWSHLQATGDIAGITGEFGGMADDDRFRLNATRHVVTSEGTYAETVTRVAVVGPDTVVQSAATGLPVDFAELVRLAPGSQISVLVQGSTQNEPVVNAYIVVIP